MTTSGVSHRFVCLEYPMDSDVSGRHSPRILFNRKIPELMNNGLPQGQGRCRSEWPASLFVNRVGNKSSFSPNGGFIAHPSFRLYFWMADAFLPSHPVFRPFSWMARCTVQSNSFLRSRKRKPAASRRWAGRMSGSAARSAMVRATLRMRV